MRNFKRVLITGINGSGDSYLTEHILTDYFVNLLSINSGISSGS